MPFLLKVEATIEKFSKGIGYFSAVVLLLLVVNVFYDVIMRYAFNDVSIGMQELEWHLYSMLFLFGVAYALSTDGHVRVDLIYEKLSPRKQGIIDIAGTLLFLLPFCGLVAWFGIDFAYNAYDIGERSGDPGGLTDRWIIKSAISVSLVCVMISALGFMLRAFNTCCGLRPAEHHENVKL